MNKICFVADAQGFFVGNKFYPREFAAAGNGFTTYHTFDLPQIQLNEVDQKTVYYCENFIHGIPWASKKKKSDSLPFEAFEIIVKHIYEKYKKSDLDMVGVRNGHLKEVLSKLNIPVYDMENIKLTYTDRTFCNLHKFESRCCINKVLNLYKLIKDFNN